MKKIAKNIKIGLKRVAVGAFWTSPIPKCTEKQDLQPRYRDIAPKPLKWGLRAILRSIFFERAFERFVGIGTRREWDATGRGRERMGKRWERITFLTYSKLITIHSLQFPSFHFTSLQFSSLLFTWLHLTWLDFTSLDFTWLDFTWLHFTWLHLTSLHFSWM